MSRSQKRYLIKTIANAVFSIALLILIAVQYNSIHNLKTAKNAVSDELNDIRQELEEIRAEQSKQPEAVELPEPEPISEPEPVTEPEPEPDPEPEPEPKLISIGEFKITGYDAYCEHCCGKTDGITASMTQATVGRTVAMHRTDMKALGISYGDTIYIDGIGERVVEDTGCGRGVIDVVCIDHAACYKITGFYDIYVKE